MLPAIAAAQPHRAPHTGDGRSLRSREQSRQLPGGGMLHKEPLSAHAEPPTQPATRAGLLLQRSTPRASL